MFPRIFRRSATAGWRPPSLFVALAMSLCLHILLFGEQLTEVVASAWHESPPEPTVTLHARLRATPVARLDAATSAQSTVQPATGMSRAPKAMTLPTADEDRPRAAAHETAVLAAAAPVAIAPADRPAAATTLAPKAAPTAAQAIADGKRGYLVDLAVAARRYRDYPRAALMEGQGGIVVVRVDLTADQAPDIRVAQGSGDARLDKAALAMIRNAANDTHMPEILRSLNLSLALPLEFSAGE